MKYNKDNPLRVFEAFAGYSSQSLALQRLKEDYQSLISCVSVGQSLTRRARNR